mmetsp:Transcript_15802/g.33620  ORF Transcript_15802/g.33620 Transcript_15802/m.33620 type:complete len:231 (+) Transcript_15802:430-1122(+)
MQTVTQMSRMIPLICLPRSNPLLLLLLLMKGRLLLLPRQTRTKAQLQPYRIGPKAARMTRMKSMLATARMGHLTALLISGRFPPYIHKHCLSLMCRTLLALDPSKLAMAILQQLWVLQQSQQAWQTLTYGNPSLQWTTKGTVESRTGPDKVVQSKASKFRTWNAAGLASHIAGSGLGLARCCKFRLHGSLTQSRSQWNQMCAGHCKRQPERRFKCLDFCPTKSILRVPAS